MRGDAKAAGIGLASLRDPDLEIDLLFAERQVVALDAADHAAAEILDVDHVARQLVVGIRQQQIGTGQRPLDLLLEFIDELIEGSGSVCLEVDIGGLAEQRERLSVKQPLDVGKSARTREADLVGPIEHDAPGTQERKLLILFGHHFEAGVVVERDRLLRAHIIRHRFQQLLRVGLTRAGTRERAGAHC